MRRTSVMNSVKRAALFRLLLVSGLLLVSVMVPKFVSAQTAIQERVWFPAFEDVTSVLTGLIDAEPTTGRIDMSAWYLSEHSISIALVRAFKRGVEIRLIGDRVAIHESDARTREEFFWIAMQGVPIRIRFNPTWYPEIDHWKAIIFKAQGKVAFGSANFTPTELKFNSSTDYKDEMILVTNDQQIVNAFLTKFDHFWADDVREPSSRVAQPYFLDFDDACAQEPRANCPALYADIKQRRGKEPGVVLKPMESPINRARREPESTMPADLIWSQGSAFNNRLVQEINAENTAIDLVVYRLTVPSITNALLTKISQRVPIRLLLEPTQYWTPPNNPPQGARVWPEYWLTKAYIDKLWAAGLDTIKQRNHVGLTHMKLLVTSRFATIASSNFAEGWQRDHDYFVPSTKPIYTALKNRFATMYASSGFTTFTPTPPDAATLATPAANATAVAATPTLTWSRAPFATSYDVFIWPSGSAQPASPVGNVPAVLNNNPPTTYSFTASLQGGTTYNWRIRSRTFAADRNPIYVAQSATRSFTTVGTGSGGQTPTLPSPWQTQDIGSVAQPGSASEANGVFTVSGSGSNIWGTADSFRYVYQTTSGDTQITARVPNPVQNTGTYAKVGVMLRASTAANAANVLLSVRPNGSLEFMSRSSTGGQTTFYGTRTQPAPAWLRLTRSGSTVTAEVSSNGSTWFQVGQPIAFSSGSLAGLIVCATSSSLNTATFDNVSVSGTVTPPPPPPPTAGNIVIYASDVPSAGVPPTSSWTPASDASSPGGVKLTTPDAGQPASASASSSPIHYFDVNFTAQTGTAYRVWFRLRAQNNSKLNDAIWAQFSGALANGSPIYRINTTSGLLVNLATTTEATSLNNWGWQNTAYWLSQPTALTFASTNQTLRVQIREDGVEIDQIVLSPSQFFNSAPGPVTNDSTIVAKP